MHKIKDKINYIRKIRNVNSFDEISDVFNSSLNILSTYSNSTQDITKRNKCLSSIFSIENAHREYVYKKSKHLAKALDILSSNLLPFQDVEIENIETTYPTEYLTRGEY